jgi:hypothetical protein
VFKYQVPKKKKKLKSKKERDRLKEGKDTGKKSGDTKDKPTIVSLFVFTIIIMSRKSHLINS